MYGWSIRATLGLVFAFLMLVGGLSVGFSLWTIRTQQHDALILNLAGWQRMLSQKIAKELWQSLLKGRDPRYLAQTHATVHQFEEGLRALLEKGQLSYAGTTVSMPLLTDPAFRTALEEVRATWELLHRPAHVLLEGEPGSPAFAQGSADVERLSEVILEKMDEAVRLYQAAAEVRVMRLRWLQLAFLLTGGMMLALGYGLTFFQVLRPLGTLKKAMEWMERGKWDYPIRVWVRNELGELARVFESMRGQIKVWTEKLEQRVEERTRELREAQEELVRKEKLATLGQLASNMAHELRQPLSVMTNALYYLRMRMKPQETDPDVKEYLGILQTEVNVAEKIVRDLLDFAHLRPPQRQAVATGEVVAEQMARFSVLSAVRVQQKFPAELPPVYVDRVQIGQVISNLLRNALEAMEKQGGTLTLAGAQAEEGQVVLSVTDTGEGIPEENLDKIFDPLFTTKARGIGLGLSVSQQLVQANGGELRVQSRVGEGTTFTLVLPVAGREP